MLKNYFTKLNLIAIILLSSITTTSNAFVTVGATIDCDYATLEDAYNDADIFVRVTTEFVSSDLFTISKTKWFTGGYDNCADAQAGTRGQMKTQWSGLNQGSVVKIDANNPTMAVVTFDNFEFFDGKDITFAGTGGISVLGDVLLILANSYVHDNQGDEGGGIRLRGENARVTIISSIIADNTGNSAGGGVYCENGASFTMLEDSTIKSNSSGGNGGGIFANSDCQISVQSGDSLSPLDVQLGIIQNQASQGGGVYLKNGADMELTGNNFHPASIVGNSSTSNISNVVIGGGGVYVTGAGTSFSGTNARIDFNFAEHSGAGFGAVSSASFSMGRLDTPCWDNDKCSSLSTNIITTETGNGAAGYVYDQANANIHQTYIANNQAELTSVIAVNRVGYLRLEGSLLVGNTSFNQPFSLQLFSVEGDFSGNLDFFYNTLSGNISSSTFLLDGSNSQQFVRINNSIIRDQGDIIVTVGAFAPALTLDCNYVHETASLSVAQSATDIFNLDPGFVDEANNDFRVVSGSFSKDLCDESDINSLYKGLNGNSRGFDDPNIVNLRGPFDAGAYEHINDLIFSSGFD